MCSPVASRTFTTNSRWSLSGISAGHVGEGSQGSQAGRCGISVHPAFVILGAEVAVVRVDIEARHAALSGLSARECGLRPLLRQWFREVGALLRWRGSESNAPISTRPSQSPTVSAQPSVRIRPAGDFGNGNWRVLRPARDVDEDAAVPRHRHASLGARTWIDGLRPGRLVLGPARSGDGEVTLGERE